MSHRLPPWARIALTVILAAAAALLPACGDETASRDTAVTVTPIPGMTVDQAVDQLVADGYPQQQNAYLNGLGSCDLGFRITGTPAEKQAAQHVADELEAMGMSNVRLEKVPVDAWEFKGASVAVGGRTMKASSFAGAPGTPADGITGEVV
jgi:type IV pilus biogenesis protein CpaD/CtpE